LSASAILMVSTVAEELQVQLVVGSRSNYKLQMGLATLLTARNLENNKQKRIL
jgi:hypothetical protein